MVESRTGADYVYLSYIYILLLRCDDDDDAGGGVGGDISITSETLRHL
jgi:hypothetical protein